MHRLGISLLMVVVIAVIGAGWVIDLLFARIDKEDISTIRLLNDVGQQLAAQIDANPNQELVSTDYIVESNASLAIMARDEIALPASLQSQLESGKELTLESDAGVVLYFNLPDSKQVLSINLPSGSQPGTGLRLLLTVAFYLSIIGFLLLWLSPLIRRLQRLAVVAKQFGEGDLERRIDTHPGSNIHDIEVEFNRMAQRIQGLLDDNRMLTGAVSHDLRTPLARLRFGVDSLAEQANDPRQSDYLTRISSDLNVMEQLVEVLLEFARLEQRLNDIPLRRIDIVPLLENIIEQVQDATDLTITLNAPREPVWVLGDERYVTMLVNNLLQNAQKFGQQLVSVSISTLGSDVCLSVEDDGPGLQVSDRERLLKPFERGDAPTGAKTSSYGLGLAIVQRIADWHGGLVTLGDSEVFNGARISVSFRSG